MAKSAKQRWLWLGGMLAATLAAAIWVDQQEQKSAAPVVTPPARSGGHGTKPEQATPRLPLEKLQARREGEAQEQVEDAFQAKSWYVPPPPPKPVPPPPPSPPPLPFAYLGKLLEAGQVTVFLTRQDRNYAVKSGETIDGAYRVESIDAQRVVFTYLPLNMQQTLVMGSVNQ